LEVGIASDLDHQQVLTQVEQARAAVAAYSSLLDVDRHALDAIVGAPVPAELLPDRLETVTAVRDLEPGLPSEVLLRRPDILATEHRLRAANANIGAARAAFFPRIALTASAGTLSPDLSKLFQSGTGTWSFVPQVGVPIFNRGRLKANLEATQLERDIAVAQYEQSIQQAFREVSDALTRRTRLAEQRAAETSLVAALDETQRLSDAKYKAGMDSYLQVLVADRALFAGQQALVWVRLAEQVNLVALYKVLGGGA
jgi:multidrug efflux system outer membrane protein